MVKKLNSSRKRRISMAEKAAEFILKMEDEKIRFLAAKDVAKRLNKNLILLSPVFFLFQKISLSKYIIREKIYRAYFILEKDQEIPAKNLSERLGFVSPQVFKDEFEKFFCVKPEMYQKIKKENKRSSDITHQPGGVWSPHPVHYSWEV
jgi:YesN/AraC family two-component response regulator